MQTKPNQIDLQNTQNEQNTQNNSDLTDDFNDKDSQAKLILNENLWKVCLQLSWPAMIAMLLYGLNTLLDAFFVGRYVSETALAGVSFVYPLTQIPVGLGSLIGVGAGSLLSILIGSRDKAKQAIFLGNFNLLLVIFSLAFMSIGLLFSETMVKMVGGSGEALEYGKTYFDIILYGSFFAVAGLAGNMVVRAEGKMKSAALLMGIGFLVNIIANYILVAVLGFGVEGAAWGTNLAMLVYTLGFYIYAGFGFISFKSKVFSLNFNKEMIKSILGLGVPSLIMALTSLVQGIVVFNALSRYGTDADVAFYGIIFRIVNLMGTPTFALMRALQPVLGINYGAKQYLRIIEAYKIFTIIGTAIIVPIWLYMMIDPVSVLNFMLPKEYLASDIFNFRVYMLVLLLLPTILMAMTYFPAVNNPKPAAILGLARQLVFYVPAMLILPALWGVEWVYIGSSLIDITLGIWIFLLMTKEFKRFRTLAQQETQ